MSKSFIFGILALISLQHLSGQEVIRGRVDDGQTRKAIAYVNIGVENSRVGTISNEDGTFSLHIPNGFSGDTIVFSAIGYKARKISLRNLRDAQGSSILLSVNPTVLDSVTVTATTKTKQYWLGNKYFRGGSIYADSIAAGSAMALLIENKYPSYHADFFFPAYVEKPMLRISENHFKEFKVRIRILELDTTTHLPGNDLLNENVIVTSEMRKGWLHFDLSSLHLKVNEPFFLVFEWILDDADRKELIARYEEYQKLNPDKVTMDTMLVRGEKIPFRNYHHFVAGTSFGASPIKFSLDNYETYYRENSFGEWKKAYAILAAKNSLI